MRPLKGLRRAKPRANLARSPAAAGLIRPIATSHGGTARRLSGSEVGIRTVEPIPRRQLVPLAVAFEGGLGGVAWLVGWLLDRPCDQTLAWDLGGAAWGVAASVPLLLALIGTLAWPIGPIARVVHFARDVVRPVFAACTELDLAIVSALAGLGEELLFRGLLQAALGRWLGPVAGLLAAGVLFGLCHPLTPGYVVFAGLTGVYLGAIWLVSGNLLVPIVAHGLYDFLALLILVKGPARWVGDAAPPVVDGTAGGTPSPDYSLGF
jgi:membrane protease YdiL (CAAX protease family)